MVIEQAVGGVGLFDRIKEAIAGVGCGLGMFVIAVIALFANERYAVYRAKTLATGLNDSVEVKPDKPEGTNDKKLIVVAGNATTEEVLKDVKFEVEAKAIKLRRSVEMYQWVEKTKTETKGSKSSKKKYEITYYEKEWSGSLNDSSRFKEKVDPDTKESHTNPSSMPFESQTQKASLVTLGGFKLTDTLIDSINEWKGLTPKAVPAALMGSGGGGGGGAEAPDDKTCPECSKTLKSAEGLAQHMKDTGHKASGGSGGGGSSGGLQLTSTGFYMGTNPSTPAIGDVRISFDQVPPLDVTVLGQQVGDSFAPYVTDTGELYELRTGKYTKEALFAKLGDELTFQTWLIRGLGWLFCMIGMGLVFRPITVVADAIPFVGGILGMGVGLAAAGLGTVVAFMTIALGWVFYRPLIGIPLIILAIAILVGLIKMASGRKKAGGEGGGPAAAPPPAPAAGDPAPAA